VRGRVARLVAARALRVVIATAEAVARGFVAIGESTAADPIGAAVARIQAGAGFAHLAKRTRGDAVATKTGIALGVHTVERTSFEPLQTDALMRFHVADLVVFDALQVVGASAKAVARGFIAIGESGASDPICAAVARIHTETRVADESTGTLGRAVAAVARVGLGVHAVETADGELYIVDSNKLGEELKALVGKKVEATGDVIEGMYGGYTITVTSYKKMVNP